MLKIDYSLFIQIANFLILLFVINIIVYRPIRKILSQRDERITSLEEGIREFQDKSEQNTKDLEESKIGARREGFKEKEDIKNKGLEEENSLIQKATNSAGEKIEKAKQDIESTIAGVRQSLDMEVENFSKEFAEKILGRSV